MATEPEQTKPGVPFEALLERIDTVVRADQASKEEEKVPRDSHRKFSEETRTLEDLRKREAEDTTEWRQKRERDDFLRSGLKQTRHVTSSK